MVIFRMSRKELSRLEWLSRVKRGEMSHRGATPKLGVSYRQSKRLWRRYQEQGEAGLVPGAWSSRQAVQSQDG